MFMSCQDTINKAIGGVIKQRLSIHLQAQVAFHEDVECSLAEQVAQERLDLDDDIF